MMEPLISKSEDYNYTFFRRMIENIKQTKDAQDPDDDETNMVSVRSYFIGHM
jgi:sister-chromatid-cohesion protein PDS5